MANQGGGLLGAIMWIVGVLVSLAVGFGMIDGVLTIPIIPAVILTIAGWIVVIGAIVGVLICIVRALK